jgi:Flp pilus assembly protein TadD
MQFVRHGSVLVKIASQNQAFCCLRFAGPFNQTLGLIVYYSEVNSTPAGLEFVMSFNFARTQSPLQICLLVSAALALAGCAKDRAETTGTISSRAAANGPADNHARVEQIGEQFRKNPADPNLAVAYAQALRQNGQQAQAAAVLQQASIKHPKNQAVLGAYGRALADNGQYQQALDVLARAHTPDRPDWRILNAQGTVLDQLNRHTEARRYYNTALKIAPNEPSVLSNLGLSYLLTKDLAKAEATLRQAAAQPNADPKVRQNLALVLGLEGKYTEAEKIAAGDLPHDQAEANIAELRAMVAQRKQQDYQQNTWQKLKAQKTASNG